MASTPTISQYLDISAPHRWSHTADQRGQYPSLFDLDSVTRSWWGTRQDHRSHGDPCPRPPAQRCPALSKQIWRSPASGAPGSAGPWQLVLQNAMGISQLCYFSHLSKHLVFNFQLTIASAWFFQERSWCQPPRFHQHIGYKGNWNF